MISLFCFQDSAREWVWFCDGGQEEIWLSLFLIAVNAIGLTVSEFDWAGGTL